MLFLRKKGKKTCEIIINYNYFQKKKGNCILMFIIKHCQVTNKDRQLTFFMNENITLSVKRRLKVKNATNKMVF